MVSGLVVAAVVLHVICLATLMERACFSVELISLCRVGSHAHQKATRGNGLLLVARSGSNDYSGAKEKRLAPPRQHGLIVEEDSS